MCDTDSKICNKVSLVALTLLAAGMCFGAFYWLGYAFEISETMQMASKAAGGAGLLGLTATAVSNDENGTAWAIFSIGNGAGIGAVVVIIGFLSLVALFWGGIMTGGHKLCDIASWLGNTCWTSQFWSVVVVGGVSISALSSFGYAFSHGILELHRARSQRLHEEAVEDAGRYLQEERLLAAAAAAANVPGEPDLPEPNAPAYSEQFRAEGVPLVPGGGEGQPRIRAEGEPEFLIREGVSDPAYLVANYAPPPVKAWENPGPEGFELAPPQERRRLSMSSKKHGKRNRLLRMLDL